MAYRVELTDRAERDLFFLYERIASEHQARGQRWFNGLERAVFSLERHPERGAVTPESRELRHLLYGRKPNVWRIIYRVDIRAEVVVVLHIRHGAEKPITPGEFA